MNWKMKFSAISVLLVGLVAAHPQPQLRTEDKQKYVPAQPLAPIDDKLEPIRVPFKEKPRTIVGKVLNRFVETKG